MQESWCSWPASAAAGCIPWLYADRSGPFPSVLCCQGCRGCCARPSTCPAGSPPPQRSAVKKKTKKTNTTAINKGNYYRKPKSVSTPCSDYKTPKSHSMQPAELDLPWKRQASSTQPWHSTRWYLTTTTPSCPVVTTSSSCLWHYNCKYFIKAY